jgi:hypothetical protein
MMPLGGERRTIFNRDCSMARITKGKLLYVFALAMMLAIPGRISAQCSSAPSLPAGCTWSPQSGSTLVSGTMCNITVDYCTSCCNGTVYCYVYEILPTGPGPYCDNVSPQTMVYWGAAYARNQAVLACGYAQPCPNTGQIVTDYLPTCWTESSPSGEYEITPCSDPSCYCEDDCGVCLNDGVPAYSGCTVTKHGTCSCTTLPNQAPWVLGTCYDLGCMNLPGDH